MENLLYPTKWRYDPISEESNPADETIRLLRNVIAARRKTDRLRPVVLHYQEHILAQHRWKSLGERETNPKDGKPYLECVILNPHEAHRLAKKDYNTYLRLCRAEADRAGLQTAFPGFCPLMEAQIEERKAISDLADHLRTWIPELAPAVDELSLYEMPSQRRPVELALQMLSDFLIRLNGHRNKPNNGIGPATSFFYKDYGSLRRNASLYGVKYTVKFQRNLRCLCGYDRIGFIVTDPASGRVHLQLILCSICACAIEVSRSEAA